MQQSKLTLIVDGNWLLLSRMSAMLSRYKDNAELCQDLKLTLIKSIKLVLRTFPDIDNVIFVSDGGSWRNDIPKPKFLVEEYKGNRERSEEVFDWDLLFKTYNEFISELQDNGINAYHEFGVEGDDWAWYWTTTLNKNNTNCIIWTQDQDLMQLIKTNSNGCFTIWWNQKKGVFIEKKNGDDEFDFFFNPYYQENAVILSNIVKNSGLPVNEIIPSHIVIDKIIRGDIGDNIKPCFGRWSSNKTRFYRVKTNEIDFDMDVEDLEKVKNYFSNLMESSSYFGKTDKNINEVVEHFRYNTQLVKLCENSYPDKIKEIFTKYEIPIPEINFSDIENNLLKSKNHLDILDMI